jgi:glycosyltransferase involved in cell wall biosynthesis
VTLRVCIVSRSWLCHERSGLTLAVASHVRILAELGHKISIIGSNPAVINEKLPIEKIFHVPSSGSGSLYSPAHVNYDQLAKAFRDCSPDIVIVEGWQTALTTAAVFMACGLGIPVLMISHGSSLHPFSGRLIDRLRALAWEPYKRFILPKLIAKVGSLTTLDLFATSPRFYDREVARKQGKSTLLLVNAPANWSEYYLPRDKRKMQVLIVGYFSPIKDQLTAIKVAALSSTDLLFKFVGVKTGGYYNRCIKLVNKLGISDRVVFVDDAECNLKEEISSSLVILSTSLTEVLPLTLLEAMASGTPFVATPVGAIPFLKGGVHLKEINGIRDSIRCLIEDRDVWQEYSYVGRQQFTEQYTIAKVEAQLLDAIESTIGRCKKNIH